jgi:gamma-glutamyl-gamma-aminobutyraldehyde dehydrogenase
VIDFARIKQLANEPVSPQTHLIGGQRRASIEGGQLDVFSPRNGQVLTSIADGTARDVDLAVGDARRAFEDGVWADQPPAARKKVLTRLADLIDSHAYELAVLGVRDNGTEIGMALKAEPGSAAGTFRYYGEAIDKIYGEVAPTGPSHLGLILKQPIGVVGVIVPWNFPLMIGAWKIAPALAVGNSVVLKPSETASLALLRVAELALEAGLPEGVFNVVTGKGRVVGEAIGLHNDIDVLAFTGSGFVGRKLLEYSAQSNLKHVYLELGGKSPNIVFNDVPDIGKAAAAAVNGIFRNSGQVCVAGSRLLLQEGIRDEFLGLLKAGAEELRVGDPLDPESDIGAINSEVQLQQNLDHAAVAEQEGATRVTGGERILQDTGGYYMAPTVFDGVRSDMKIAREEVFGPVLCVMTFDDENDAIEIANSTNFGLAAGVWTSDLSRAHRMVQRIQSGVVHVNCYGGADITVPLGGLKQSGNGHDKSLHALDKYTALKTAWIAL